MSAAPSADAPDDGRRTSRRGFLLGAGLAVLGGTGGLVAGLAADRSTDVVEPPRPELLLGAVEAERDLLADLDATLAQPADGTDPALLRLIRRNHAAHLSALLAAVTLASGAAPEPSASSSSAPVVRRGTARDVATLRNGETSASRRAAEGAASASGHDAALLASIAACEATHAELLR